MATPNGTGSSLRQADTAAQARIQALSREKRALEAKVAELTEQVAAVGDVPALQKEIGDLKAARKADASRWGQERALMASGIDDPEGVDVALYAYGRLPEEGRPELAAWLADTAKLPKAVAAYKPTPAATTDVAAAAAAAQLPAGSRLPAATAAAVPPAPVRATAAAAAAVLASPAYKALTPAEKKAKLAELQASVNAAPAAA